MEERQRVAALFVDPNGVYAGLPDVDVWDEARDARLYPGPWPVVAHPPCGTWSRNLCFVNQARWGKMVGDDGGCFTSALESVRRWGGVLEHPAHSVAWERFGLPVPGKGGWTQAFDDHGLTTEVSQVVYGHAARKRTWLYFIGSSPPELDWREWAGSTIVCGEGIHGHRASATPPAFRDVLLATARASVHRAQRPLHEPA